MQVRGTVYDMRLGTCSFFVADCRTRDSLLLAIVFRQVCRKSHYAVRLSAQRSALLDPMLLDPERNKFLSRPLGLLAHGLTATHPKFPSIRIERPSLQHHQHSTSLIVEFLALGFAHGMLTHRGDTNNAPNQSSWTTTSGCNMRGNRLDATHQRIKKPPKTHFYRKRGRYARVILLTIGRMTTRSLEDEKPI